MCYLQRHFYLLKKHKEEYPDFPIIHIISQCQDRNTMLFPNWHDTPIPTHTLSLRIAPFFYPSIIQQHNLSIIVHSIGLKHNRKYQMHICVLAAMLDIMGGPDTDRLPAVMELINQVKRQGQKLIERTQTEHQK